MTPSELIDVRLKNGKLCDGYKLVDGKRKLTNPMVKSTPEDMKFASKYGNSMHEFWEHALSQRELLWALRSIGRDNDADKLWRDLSVKYGIKLNQTVITDIERKFYADEVRDNYECPIEFKD